MVNLTSIPSSIKAESKYLLQVELLLNNPKFWILLLFSIRLFHIDLDPVGAPSWRQAMTLGVARNYVEWDWNFFHPRTLLCDSREGIFAQEFPLYNYIVAIGWSIFGQENWVFRMISLYINSLGLWWLYLVVRRILNHRSAISAMILFGSSIAFIYARKGMPDVFSVSLALGGVLYGWKFLENGKWKDAVLFFVLATFGMLSKIPSATVLTLLLFPFLSTKIGLKPKVISGLISILSVSCVFLWYFVWVPWAETRYGFRLFYSKPFAVGLKEIVSAGYETLDRFEIIAFQNKLTFYLCILGLFSLIVKRMQSRLFITWLAASVVFFFFMIKAGFVFSSHEYYVIPYIPIMSIFGGLAIDNWLPKKKWFLPITLCFLAAIGIYFQWHRFFVPEEDKKYLTLETICDKIIPKEARILTSDHDGSPKMMYFCHRRGWSDDERWKDEKWLAGEATVGMDFVVVERFRHDKKLSIPLIFENEDFLIYQTIPRE